MYDQYQEEEGGFPWGGAALGGAAALGLGGFSKVGRTGMRALGGAADTMGGNVGPMVGNSLRGMADMYERGGEKIGGGIRNAMGAFGNEFKDAYPQTFGPGGTVSNVNRTLTDAVADWNPQRAKELFTQKAAAREAAKTGFEKAKPHKLALDIRSRDIISDDELSAVLGGLRKAADPNAKLPKTQNLQKITSGLPGAVSKLEAAAQQGDKMAVEMLKKLEPVRQMFLSQ